MGIGYRSRRTRLRNCRKPQSSVRHVHSAVSGAVFVLATAVCHLGVGDRRCRRQGRVGARQPLTASSPPQLHRLRASALRTHRQDAHRRVRGVVAAARR